MSKLVIGATAIDNAIRYTTPGWNNLITYVTHGAVSENTSAVSIKFVLLEYTNKEKVILIRVTKGAGYWYKHILYNDDMSYQMTIDNEIIKAGFNPTHESYSEKVVINLNEIHRLMGPANKEIAFMSLINEISGYVCTFTVPVNHPTNEHGNWSIEWSCNGIPQPEIYMNAREYLKANDRAEYFRVEVIQNWEVAAKAHAEQIVSEIAALINTPKRKV